MSIKILHTSDWHLGKTFRETTFELLPIQKQVLQEIVEIAIEEQPEIVIIAGDIFDTYNPPFEAEKLFYETISKLSQHGCFVIAIAGNHDSPEKLQISKPLLRGKHPIFIMSNPLDDLSSSHFENDNFHLSTEGSFLKLKLKTKNSIIAIKPLPYLSEVRLGLSGDDFIGKIGEVLSEEPEFTCDYFLLASHIYVAGAQQSGSERILQIGGAEYIPAEFLPEKADYIALGHLHKYQNIRNAFYSGSIYSFDLSEIEHKKGVCIWQEKELKFIEFKKAPQIKKLEFETVEEAIKNAPEDEQLYYVTIKTGQNYTTASIDGLLKAYKNKLVNWRFHTSEETGEIQVPDINSLSEDRLFIEFYKTKFSKEPPSDLVKLFLETLQEVKNAAN